MSPSAEAEGADTGGQQVGAGEDPPAGRPLLSSCRVFSSGQNGLAHLSLMPVARTPPSWPSYLPKAQPSHAITLGVRPQHVNLGGT